MVVVNTSTGVGLCATCFNHSAIPLGCGECGVVWLGTEGVQALMWKPLPNQEVKPLEVEVEAGTKGGTEVSEASGNHGARKLYKLRKVSVSHQSGYH